MKREIDNMREGEKLIVKKMESMESQVDELVDIKGKIRRKGVSLSIIEMKIEKEKKKGKIMMKILGQIEGLEREMMMERKREGIEEEKEGGK